MTNPLAFLDGDPDELGEALLQVARRERAPHAARERALAGVAAASVGLAAATSAKAALAAPSLAAPSLASGGGMLAAKWLGIGLAGALVGLTAVDQARRVLVPADEPTAAPPVATAPALSPSAAPSPRVEPQAVVAAPALPALPVREGAAQASSNAPSVPASPDPAAPAPSVADFAAPDGSSLAREVAALRQARGALAAAQPSRALEILAAYRREFPVGVLGTEEAALRVEIAFALGDARAPELAQRFLTEHASSPLSARVQSLLDAKRASGGKP